MEFPEFGQSTALDHSCGISKRNKSHSGSDWALLGFSRVYLTWLDV